jgi:5-methylcytosine-specific restriction protein A
MSRAHKLGTTTEWRKLRAACFRVWGKTCMYCGDRASDVDHIIELALGGTNTIDNVQPLCKPCHMAKTVRFNSTKSHTEPPRGDFSQPVPQIGRAHV